MNFGEEESLKDLFGEIPVAAELYWLVRQRGKPVSRFSLKHLQAILPDLVMQAGESAERAPAGKKVLFFASLHYWIEHAALLSLALAGLGHQ